MLFTSAVFFFLYLPTVFSGYYLLGQLIPLGVVFSLFLRHGKLMVNRLKLRLRQNSIDLSKMLGGIQNERGTICVNIYAYRFQQSRSHRRGCPCAAAVLCPSARH